MIDPIRAALERLVELDEKRAWHEWSLAFAAARAALAAEPPAPDPQPVGTLHVSDFRGYTNYEFQQLGDLPVGQHKLFTAPPAPDHIPGATEMVADGARLRQCPTHGQQPANAWGCPECLRELREELARIKAPVTDGEREDLAQWLEANAQTVQKASGQPANGARQRFRRAAALLRQPAPVPVPVAERPWEQEGWCDAEGRCWFGAPVAGAGEARWTLTEPLVRLKCETFSLPHWALPQPPQGGEGAE